MQDLEQENSQFYLKDLFILTFAMSLFFAVSIHMSLAVSLILVLCAALFSAAFTALFYLLFSFFGMFRAAVFVFFSAYLFFSCWSILENHRQDFRTRESFKQNAR